VTLRLRRSPGVDGDPEAGPPADPGDPADRGAFVVLTDGSGAVRWASMGARAVVGARCEGRALWHVMGDQGVHAIRMYARAQAAAGVVRGPVVDVGAGRVGILCVDGRPLPGRPDGWLRWHVDAVPGALGAPATVGPWSQVPAKVPSV
jgi:hypothetical protein